ncbi:ribosomal protein S18 acetylase RimI-like enzyme [Pedobacter africanus]|uniref:Ribosomal protein S18 acetylase RimI-like enzyme n=1 Tax=Pedobacter africanus TaxID=151894 RepID=A0ACC6KRX4_9SPHI|nr:GNAT family N-acetyltransferase [Pedobacter africanus]MDR6781882.1 ribosomal protein S18 acetylase RimI-like enzyme [Pedobacter africanus]
MNVILDNPIWFALNSVNAHLGSGNDSVKLFNTDVAPFAGLNAYTPGNFQQLFELVQPDQVAVLFYPKEDLDPAPFDVVAKVPGYQMVFEGKEPEAVPGEGLVHLTEKDVEEMLSLTKLTQPGPFARRTIDFGGYKGIFQDQQLVAMAGQRLQVQGFTEISAVCTHPDSAGKGLARKVLNELIRDVIASGNIPYLHVRADNTRAIKLYEHLGFVIRTEMYFHVIKRS